MQKCCGAKPTRHSSPVIADVVSIGLPVVVVFRLMKGAKCHRESGREILHQHPQLLIHHSPTGADGEDRRPAGSGRLSAWTNKESNLGTRSFFLSMIIISYCFSSTASRLAWSVWCDSHLILIKSV